ATWMSRISSTVRSRYASSGPRAVTATSVPQQSQTVASTSTASATCEAALIVAARNEVMPAPSALSALLSLVSSPSSPLSSCPACVSPTVLRPSSHASPILLSAAGQNETKPCSTALPSLCTRTGGLQCNPSSVECDTMTS